MKKLLMLLSLLLLVAGVGTSSASTFYYSNFNHGIPPEWSGNKNLLEGVQGYAGLGSGGNVFSGDFLRNESGGYGITPTPTVLTLTGLPAHTSVRLGFLLAIIGSWDGNSKDKINRYPVGPDYFNVEVDGKIIFSETFRNFASSNVPGESQTFSGVMLGGGLSDQGFNYINPNPPGNTVPTVWLDSAYAMSLDMPHTGATLTVEWFASGAGWQGENAKFGITHDESWAIDNVRVDLNGVHAPLPATLPLLGSGLLGLGLLGFRKKSQA